MPFLATDTAEDIAARLAIAINSSGVPGLNAFSTGPQVSLIGGTVQSTDVLPIAGAPGGTITGTAILNGVMYAVSNTGGLFRVTTNLVQPSGSPSPGNIGAYVTSSYDLLGINFAGLTAAPNDVLNGALANMLIGIDTQGTLYAFNTAGQLQKIFKGGLSSVSTGLSNATGLAFSTLDNNLWHVSNLRTFDAGHGLPVTPDGSRTVPVAGGSTLYFGTEQANVANRNYNFLVAQPVPLRASHSTSVVSRPVLLPTLYFNYWLATEDASAAFQNGVLQTQFMRDSLRVYISGEDGEWVLAATTTLPRV